MKFVVLATATDEAAKSEAEEMVRFEELRTSLQKHRVTIEAQLALLGKYDYLLVLEAPDDIEDAFASLSSIAQSGRMRTETFAAIPLASYFGIAAEVGARSASA